jgi:hypothetical protein
MKKQLFDEYGNFLGKIPAHAVKACSHAGDCYEVKYWQNKLNFVCPRQLAINYLQEFGAWEDLNTVDDVTINQRVLWIACCDIKETGEWFGLIN